MRRLLRWLLAQGLAAIDRLWHGPPPSDEQLATAILDWTMCYVYPRYTARWILEHSPPVLGSMTSEYLYSVLQDRYGLSLRWERIQAVWPLVCTYLLLTDGQ